WFTRSWVISNQSVTPDSLPTYSLSFSLATSGIAWSSQSWWMGSVSGDNQLSLGLAVLKHIERLRSLVERKVLGNMGLHLAFEVELQQFLVVLRRIRRLAASEFAPEHTHHG